MSFETPVSTHSLKRDSHLAFGVETAEETAKVKRTKFEKDHLAPSHEDLIYRKHIEVIDDKLVCHFIAIAKQLDPTSDLTSNRVITNLLKYNNSIKKIDATVLLFDQEFLMALNRSGGSITSLTLRVDSFSDIEQISLPGLFSLRELTLHPKNSPLPPVSQATINRLLVKDAANSLPQDDHMEIDS